MSIRINVGTTYDGRDLQRAQRELDALKREADTLSNKMTALGTGFQTAGRRIGSVGSTLTRSVTLPIVGAGVAAVRTATDFESSFAKIEGLVGVTGDDLELLREAAARLGPEFGQSANEAAEAMFFITSAGLRGQVAIDVLEQSLQAAAVGLGDAATIADLSTSAINAYGEANLSAVEATDILTAAVREGKLEPDELAGAMGRVLPIASAMGISFDQVGATFAAMSRTGTNANEAATQLRGIMTTLLRPTVQAEEALGEMGLSSEELRQQIRDEGLLSVLETLVEEFENNEVGAERVFGNVRALSGVMDLMGSNVEGTRDIFEAMTETTGALEGAFAATAETSQFQFNQAMSEVKSALGTVGEILLPFVRDFVSGFQEIVETFRALSPEQQKQVVQYAAIAAAIGPVLIVMGKLFTAIGTIIKGFVAFGKAALFLFTNPIGLIIVGIAAVVAAGVLLYKNWDKVKEVALDVWSSVSTAFGTAWDAIKETAKSAGNFVIGMLNAVIGAYEGAVNAIAGALNSLPFVGKTLSIPDWVPVVGGRSFSIPSVPTVQFPRIPELAEGGIVQRETLAIIGEAGPEAVVPLDRFGEMGGGTVVNVYVNGGDPQQVVEAIRRYTRTNGPLGQVVTL